MRTPARSEYSVSIGKRGVKQAVDGVGPGLAAISAGAFTRTGPGPGRHGPEAIRTAKIIKRVDHGLAKPRAPHNLVFHGTSSA